VKGNLSAFAVSHARITQTTVCETCSPTLVALLIVFVLRSAEFLGESDEKSFRPADVAEPIRVFILDYFAYELRAAITKPSIVSSMSSTANMTRR
jgi:hypothetical protein